jgi:hypothetical protein
MPENSHVDGHSDPSAAAAYIAEMSSNLAQIARRHGLNALGFILDMARLEAETLSLCSRVSNEGNTTLRDEHSG